MKPVIGITLNEDVDDYIVFLSQFYFRVIEEVGGIPILIPPIKNPEVLNRILDMVNGLILSGGGDVDPVHINEEPIMEMGRITPDRDYAELELTKGALKRDISVLAICRGMQLLNIVAGGTIYQDINTQIRKVLKHKQEAPKGYPTHGIKVKEESKLFSIVGAEQLRVNSFHHQAIAKPALDFLVTGQSIDGVIEAIESQKHNFVIGVQWHPECMWERNPQAFRIFERFVQSARR